MEEKNVVLPGRWIKYWVVIKEYIYILKQQMCKSRHYARMHLQWDISEGKSDSVFRGYQGRKVGKQKEGTIKFSASTKASSSSAGAVVIILAPQM